MYNCLMSITLTTGRIMCESGYLCAKLLWIMSILKSFTMGMANQAEDESYSFTVLLQKPYYTHGHI